MPNPAVKSVIVVRIVADGAVFEVIDTQKQGGNLFLHKGKLVSGTFAKGQSCTAQVDATNEKQPNLIIQQPTCYMPHLDKFWAIMLRKKVRW